MNKADIMEGMLRNLNEKNICCCAAYDIRNSLCNIIIVLITENNEKQRDPAIIVKIVTQRNMRGIMGDKTGEI